MTKLEQRIKCDRRIIELQRRLDAYTLQQEAFAVQSDLTARELERARLEKARLEADADYTETCKYPSFIELTAEEKCEV